MRPPAGRQKEQQRRSGGPGEAAGDSADEMVIVLRRSAGPGCGKEWQEPVCCHLLTTGKPEEQSWNWAPVTLVSRKQHAAPSKNISA